MFTAALVLTGDSNGIPRLENFIDTTPNQHSLVEDRIEVTVLEKEESSSQNFKKQGATTSSLGSQKSEVEIEHGKVQIWSKHNVSLALKMRGINVRWRRRQATKDSRIVSKKTKEMRNCNDEMASSESKKVSTGLEPLLVPSESIRLVKIERTKAELSPSVSLGVLLVTSARVSETARSRSTTKCRERKQRRGNVPPPPPKPPTRILWEKGTEKWTRRKR